MAWPTLGQVTTAGAIRDRIIAVIEALTPVQQATPFKHYHNQAGANFLAWAENEAAASFRRFQVRHTGKTDPPKVTNTDYEELEATFSILVAYPQTARAGAHQALDRDDLMDRDFIQINYAVGLDGGNNFASPNPNASWRASQRALRTVGKAIDFLSISMTYAYLRSTTA